MDSLLTETMGERRINLGPCKKHKMCVKVHKGDVFVKVGFLGERRLSPSKMLFKNNPYLRKIEKYHTIDEGLVVSFEMSTWTSNSDHRSSRYEHFCVRLSKMHGASELGRVHLPAFHVAYMW